MLTKINSQTVTGAKSLLLTLKKFSIDTIFGYPGSIVLNLYEELYNDNEIKHILVRHEQSAVHAAEGYARVSGKCAVVLVTSGPGATNTVTGIVNAYLDGYPIVVITGQVSRNLLGKNAFQEANICEIAKSCTKKTYQVTKAQDIQPTLENAIITATSGKKGPVVVDIVKEALSEFTDIKFYDNDIKISRNFYNLKALEQKIAQAKFPVIVAGGGVKHSNAEDDLLDFAQKTNIPVVSTMMGLGTYPQNLSNYFGMIGVFGDNCANKILKESDLVISLGARFNDRITNRKEIEGKLFQIDINEEEISNFVEASDYIVGDIKSVLSNINVNKNFNNLISNIQYYRNLNIERSPKTNMLHSFEVIRQLEHFTKGQEIIFTSEVGQHQIWAVQNLSFYKQRQILLSGGTGTMGFGLPAAIGAAIANPEKDVVCITGDGSFQMSLHELATCKENNLNIKIIILNNGYLGMVRQMQEKLFNEHYSQTKIFNPDFVKLANSYNIPAVRVNSLINVKQAFDLAFAQKGPFVLEFMIESMEVL